jgi:hypothetical protein
MARLIGAFDSWSAWWNYVGLSLKREEQTASWANQYNMLRAYYLNNGVYEVLDTLLTGLGVKRQELRPLRNPAFRVVEFYAAKLWPGTLPAALPIVTKNPRIIDPIQQVWTWSNWGSEKQAAARWFACYGDMFIKVSTRENLIGEPSRVFLQNIEPQFVTDFDADERGYLTYVRIDIPRQRRDGDKTINYLHTEVWTKEDYRLWEHNKEATTPTEQLGPPKEQKPLSDFGIDFVPIVWQAFRNIGDQRGMAAITPAIDKIDEANRQATRLHQMLFRYNRALWALAANAQDAQGRPLPPPRLGDSSADNTLEMDDDTIVRLPGMSTLSSLVPALNYESALSVIDAQMSEIQRDLPELAYYELRGRDVSGVAAELLLGDAIDRLLEARGNAEGALIRADQMALTIGIAGGIFDEALGTYEDGALDHMFADRPVLTTSESERAKQVEVWVKSGLPLRSALRRVGFSEDELTAMDDDAATEKVNNASFADAVLGQAQRQFDRGEPV